MKRRILLAGCVLAWGLTALMGAAELFFLSGWVYYTRYAAENMRAAEDAGTAGFITMLLLPLFLLALWGAVWSAMCCKDQGDSGQRPVEKR